MIQYVNNPDNLKLIMILLSDKSKNLQFEGFNIFKVFVANPTKTKQIQDILIKNREKLLFFLENFNPIDKNNENSTFKDEKEFVLQKITDLPRIISTNNPNSLS
jgi:calcium binding protein 39